MAHSLIKAEKVVAQALGLLDRELTIAKLVFRDAQVDFKGAKGDAVTVRVPAFAVANERALRSGTARTRTTLAENVVQLQITDDLYLDVEVSDEQMNLDIADFGLQVVSPITSAIARKVDEKLGALMSAPKDGYGQALVYDAQLTYTDGTDTPYEVAVQARQKLNNARVPKSGRSLIVGSALESAFLNDPLFVDADKSGSTATRTESLIGRVAGFEVHSSDGIDPDKAYAIHSTAFAMTNVAPAVPQSAAWGSVGSYNGAAIRLVRDFDTTAVADVMIADSWFGASAVTDEGHYDANGLFVPSATQLATNDVAVDGGTPTPDTDDARRLVRAVEITAV